MAWNTADYHHLFLPTEQVTSRSAFLVCKDSHTPVAELLRGALPLHRLNLNIHLSPLGERIVNRRKFG